MSVVDLLSLSGTTASDQVLALYASLLSRECVFSEYILFCVSSATVLC